MGQDSGTLFIEAVGWGGLSAISAVIGAWIGLEYRISHTWRSSLMAFGAGALLFATTSELFAKALFEYHDYKDDPEYYDRNGGSTGVILLVFFGAVGALLFIAANKFLDERGAFERKRSTLDRFLHAHKKAAANPDDPLQHSDHESISATSLQRVSFAAEVDNSERARTGGNVFDQAFAPHHQADGAGGHAHSRTSVGGGPAGPSGIPRAMTTGTYGSLNSKAGSSTESDQLIAPAVPRSGDDDVEAFAASHQAEATTRAVGMAIYLGLLIDSVPESFIIGVMVKDNELTTAFMLGVFLSNLPEALSSADIMKLEGHSKRTILLLWVGLVFVTALGAGLGAVIIQKDAHLEQRALEGLGGGAMLAVICGTMIPEAFSHGGNRTAISTVGGFLTAVCFSIIFDS